MSILGGYLKALIGHDDPATADVISLAFRMGWPRAVLISAHRGASLVDMVKREDPNIVLIGLDFPDMEGFDVIAEIRAFSDVALVVITDRGEEMDRVRGLEVGADDYIVRPVGPLELLARLRAVLRRTDAHHLAPPVLNQGGVFINPRAQQVKLHGKEIKLTPTEYKLLCELVSNSGETVSQQALIEKVWGEEYLDTPKILKVHIHRLRRKLGDNPDNPQMIVTVSRRGYRFELGSAQAGAEQVGMPT